MDAVDDVEERSLPAFPQVRALVETRIKGSVIGQHRVSSGSAIGQQWINSVSRVCQRLVSSGQAIGQQWVSGLFVSGGQQRQWISSLSQGSVVDQQWVSGGSAVGQQFVSGGQQGINSGSAVGQQCISDRVIVDQRWVINSSTMVQQSRVSLNAKFHTRNLRLSTKNCVNTISLNSVWLDRASWLAESDRCYSSSSCGCCCSVVVSQHVTYLYIKILRRNYL